MNNNEKDYEKILEQQRKEIERLKQTQKNMEYEQRRIETERRNRERREREERERIEYQRWYNSLSPEEKKREDAKKGAEKAAEEKAAEEFERKLKKVGKIILIIILSIIVLVLCVSCPETCGDELSCVSCMEGCDETSKIEGTYYLVSITGTGDVSANRNSNYLVLYQGTCTLHFTLTRPAGSSIFTYNYTGNKVRNIIFEEDFIYMDYNGRVIIKMVYENGYYNTFTYEKS